MSSSAPDSPYSFSSQQVHQLIGKAIPQAVSDVCSIMLGCEVNIASTVLIDHPRQSSDGVTALIGMAGPWIGTGALSCSPEVARNLAESLLGSEYPEMNEEVLDAIAEITNMIIGNLKSALEDAIGPMGLSTPTVIHGSSFSTRISGATQWTLIPCDVIFANGTPGKFDIQICLLPNHENQNQKFDFVAHLLTK